MKEVPKSRKDLVASGTSTALVKLPCQVIQAAEPGFCSSAEAQPLHRLIEEIQKMANALRRTLAARP